MKKYFYFRKSNNKLEMVSDGLNQYDQSKFYVEIMTITKPKLEEVLNAKITYLKNKKLEITPQTNKQEILDELEQADDISKIKQVIEKLLK